MEAYRVDLPININLGMLRINIAHIISEKVDEEGPYIEDKIHVQLKNGDYFLVSKRTERIDKTGVLNEETARIVARNAIRLLMQNMHPSEIVDYYYASKQDFEDAGASEWYYTEEEIEQVEE